MAKLNPEDLIGETTEKYKILDLFFNGKKKYFIIECTKCGEVRNLRCDVLRKTQSFCKSCDKVPLCKTRTYNSWDAMVQRTNNPASKIYQKYGAVGITCYEDWKIPGGQGWINFLNYMGECPEGCTLDRWPNKFGNYEPGNVRWATNSEQGFNQKRRSTNKSGRTGVHWNNEKNKWEARITVNNKSMCLGLFKDFEGAVKAREEAELKYFGENKE